MEFITWNSKVQRKLAAGRQGMSKDDWHTLHWMDVSAELERNVIYRSNSSSITSTRKVHRIGGREETWLQYS